jgi:hypothetical protein
MIYLTPGVTQSIWLSLRESAPVGSTGSFRFEFTNDISGQKKVFYPADLQPDNKWSRYEWNVGTPENLSSGRFDMRPGMWSYVITDGEVLLESDKILVEESKVWQTVDRPGKNINAVKR